MLTAWKHDLTVWNISIISISATRNKIQYGLTSVQNEESENRRIGVTVNILAAYMLADKATCRP